MKAYLSFLVLMLSVATTAASQPVQAPVAQVPVTMEYYYRIKWGAEEEFLQLYNRNHAPLLREMQKLGFLSSVRLDKPFTHMAGDERWDMRVTVVFRDATAAISDPEWDRQWALARKRLYADQKAFDSEEARRFALLEEHWDIVVNQVRD